MLSLRAIPLMMAITPKKSKTKTLMMTVIMSDLGFLEEIVRKREPAVAKSLDGYERL